MTAGRKPVPSHLKLITGNPGHRPIEDDTPPAVSLELPECPDWLMPTAQAEWARIVPELQIAGLIAKVDRAALAMYCQAFGRWQFAEEQIRALHLVHQVAAEGLVGEAAIHGGGLVVSAANGYKMLSQWLVISNRAQEQLKAYLGEFGMSPVSRARVKGMAAGGQLPLLPGDPMESFLRAGAKAPA